MESAPWGIKHDMAAVDDLASQRVPTPFAPAGGVPRPANPEKAEEEEEAILHKAGVSERDADGVLAGFKVGAWGCASSTSPDNRQFAHVGQQGEDRPQGGG